jgi:TRAP-type uncharacterized transport system substrate-binding protein
VRSWRDETGGLRVSLLIALAAAVGLAVAVWLLDLVPPKHLSIAAGRPGGAYYTLAEQYARILARDGISVEILDTAGSVENVEALVRKDDPADAAFLQGGVPLPEDAPVLALAATFLEPLWIFHRGALAQPADPLSWRDLSIAAGEAGSGTRFVVDAVVAALGADPGQFRLVPIGGAEAADALQSGSVDVALFVAPVDAPYLQPLFAAPDMVLSPIRDTEALVRRLPFAMLTDIPRAGLDYAAVRPPDRIELLAMVGRLVAQGDLHASLVDRLVRAARELHSDRDLITEEGAFPGTAGLELSVNPQAATLLSKPPSPLYRFLPYWVVAQINSFALLLLPVLVILIPLMRAVPGLYQWRMRSRVYRHYLALLEIDREAITETDGEALDTLDRRLDAIEADLVAMRLPLRFREYAYTLRVHLDLVRRRITARKMAV